MTKRITFMLMSPSHGEVRQYRISKILITILILTCLTGFCLGAYGFYRHYATRDDRKELAALLNENQNQQGQIEVIQSEVEALENRIARLQQMDKEIRNIANPGSSQSPVFNPEARNAAIDEGVPARASDDSSEQRIGRVQSDVRQPADFEPLSKFLVEDFDLLPHSPAIWPTRGWLTSDFGQRQSPFTGMREFHRGLDVATKSGTPVIAPGHGIVVEIGQDEAPGRFLRLDHGLGCQTYYAHLDQMKVRKGQRVERGQVIATVGDTGRSTGPHLHYEVLIGGLPVDPLRYILE